MNILFWLLLVPATIGSLLYFRIALLLSTAILTLLLVLWTNYLGASSVWQTLVWIGFLALAIPLNIPMLRRQLISNRALKAFRSVMPDMSQTERDALEAGTVWWDGELFSGKPDWQSLIDMPAPQLSPEEQAFIDGPVDQLCRLLDDWKITHEYIDLPPAVWQFLKDNGFFGMIIPKKYGGLEFSALGHSAVVMKIAGRSITAAVTVMVPNSLGPAELVLRYGTDSQKGYYLKRLAKGEEIPSFALTSTIAGSDATSMTDTGVVCRESFKGEKDVLGIRLNWEKRYITLGPVATVLGLAFKLHDPDHLIGNKDDLGITCALIPTNTPGVEIGRRHFPLNSAFQNGPNHGKDVFIPIDWIIGGQAMAGHGWRMLMECLATGRSISLPALATGASKLVCRATGGYARIRQQFNTPIGRFEGVEEILARMAAGTYMLDAARTLTVTAVDLGESPAVVSAIAKYNMTEWMRTLLNDAMDTQGGSAICMGPRNLLARGYQSIPISITVEGANILTRSLIIFGQGVIRCHPYVFKELEAANNDNPLEAEQAFDKALFGHLGFTLSNATRTLFLGLTRSKFVQAPVKGPSRRYYRRLTRFSSAFAFVSDIAMAVLGGSLKRKEALSGRLADVLSYLYLASAVLKRFNDQGQPAADLPLVQWSIEHALRVMQQSLDRFLINFPVRPIAWVLRRIVFPLGKTFSGPTDAIAHKAADILLHPSEARDRLTRGMFLPLDEASRHTEPLGRIEYALQCIVAATPADKKLRTAIKSATVSGAFRHDQIDDAVDKDIITAEEADLIRQADAMREEVVAVDDFDPAELAPHREQHEPMTKPEPPAAKECA